MPKLSIITINLNNALGLQKTIRSVLSQTFQDFEYIIIDGGSRDGSVEIIKQFEDKITYWISEPDAGIYAAMNKGIKASNGEYCQFLNSGDCLVQADVTEKMLYEMPETSILIGNMLKVLPTGKIITDKGIRNEQPTFLTFYKGTLNHSPAYIRRNLFKQYGYYDESLRIVSDWKWYLYVIGLYNETIVYKNINVSLFDMMGLSNIHIDLLHEERRRVLNEIIPMNILSDYDKYSFDIEQMQRLKSFKFSRIIIWYLERLLFKLNKT
ncbi:glycosyltransferase family 2 protein [Spirosoma fluviale]|uniref:Glycosyltransferase involved in cell wall bisynthesis n=1 Tax=Spirosoma fluviale TaxID=1597977 RepID=A0A286FDB9_9BACT|nr:glycosyltransferase family 2 protein [Spirosoma fluviale]SOD81228.1 Glycosyltransferase involved in cell wall bisynthesis [Spirosoma fluviale]